MLEFEKSGDGSLTASDLSHRYLWLANAVDQLMADEQLLPFTAGTDGTLVGRGAGGEGAQ